MKLSKIAQVVMISCSILALTACSAHKRANDAAVGDANAAAQTSGLGEEENYGDQGGASSEQLLAKRTYYFDFDRSDVHEEDKPAILANADYLVAHTEAKIILEGHTDPRGSREYNVALGERRANAVLEILKSRGVNPDQVRVVSYGAERLAAAGHTEQDYQLDRRAVIVKTQN